MTVRAPEVAQPNSFFPAKIPLVNTLVADVREMVVEQSKYRDLLVQMTKRDLLLRYKQTAMGFAWATVMPLVNTALFSIIFTRVAHVDVKIPYPLFAFSGLLAWNFFAASLKFSSVSLTTNLALVTKVYFPREIFPLSAVLVCLVDTAVASVVLIALMAYYQIFTPSTLPWLPLVIAVHVVFTLGCSLLLAMANVFYRDVKYLFDIILMVWMFATSVLYPVSQVSGRAGALMRANPMTSIVDGYRDVLFFGTSPVTMPFIATAIGSVVLLGVAWLIFHRAEYTFAEHI
jgi:lipopolysaccharide transport system permease protein